MRLEHPTKTTFTNLVNVGIAGEGKLARSKHVLAAIVDATRSEDAGSDGRLKRSDDVNVEASGVLVLRVADDYRYQY
jgi:hypothetical protein